MFSLHNLPDLNHVTTWLLQKKISTIYELTEFYMIQRPGLN